MTYLVGFEACGSRQFEVDFLLEENRFFSEELANSLHFSENIFLKTASLANQIKDEEGRIKHGYS
jgi:hypothetical protein